MVRFLFLHRTFVVRGLLQYNKYQPWRVRDCRWPPALTAFVPYLADNHAKKYRLNRDGCTFTTKELRMRTSAAQSAVESFFSTPAETESAASVSVQVAEAGLEPVASPARQLQARLESGYADGRAAETADTKGRWPLYLALPFWAGVSMLMWAGVIGLVWVVSRHL
jgi:hypothetical protein